MAWTTLIGVDELAAHLDDCVVVDCRHDLADPAYGPAAWAAGHLPGAFFLHQDSDLAGAKTGRNGRHPLPDREALRRRLEELGLRDGVQLVTYDDAGAMFAVRLWWLARWLGHAEAAVLDGGLPAWSAAGRPLSREPGRAHRRPGTLTLRAPRVAQVDAAAVLAGLGDAHRLVVDARAPERYRGEVEPLDPVAGHIPGAVNRPFQDNLRPDGRFKPAAELHREFAALLDGHDPASLVHHCGSGVSACHNLLAMELAGLPGGALYPGSWSEWCADPARPVATGARP
ncbi:MAG: sulfurtransferase [Burkholderiales bacterium]|nr:sulfurtransferase [Burkholderiales bacterium]OJX02481.1 MAG: sulfurtransferase [Burkholderiales bacterium 70-64]